MLYEANREDSSITLILFGLSGQDAPLLGSQAAGSPFRKVSAVLFELEVSKISAEALASERPDVEKKYFPIPCDARQRYGRLDAALTLKSGERLMEEGRGGLRLGRLLHRAEAHRAAHGQRRERESEPQRRLCPSSRTTRREITSAFSMIFISRAASYPLRSSVRGDMDDAASSSDGGSCTS